MHIISGAELAADIYKSVAEGVRDLGKPPELLIILASDDAAARKYVEKKNEQAADLGITVRIAEFAPTASAEEIISRIQQGNADPATTGIMVQLPLYESLSPTKQRILDTILPSKDVDGLTSTTLGEVMTGTNHIYPATVAAIHHVLTSIVALKYMDTLEGKHIVVVNHSTLIGQPLASSLLRRNATVTVAHRYTLNLGELTKTADIIITATGQAGLITADMVGEGVGIIDVTSVKTENGVRGDVARDSLLESKVKWITPVPGGIGPMTIAHLLNNLLSLALVNQPAK